MTRFGNNMKHTKTTVWPPRYKQNIRPIFYVVITRHALKMADLNKISKDGSVIENFGDELEHTLELTKL